MIGTIFLELRLDFRPGLARLRPAWLLPRGSQFRDDQQILRRPMGRRGKACLMSFDPRRHLGKLDRLDLTDEAKLALIHSLNDWAKAFVGRAFGDLPAQTVRTLSETTDSNTARDIVPSPGKPATERRTP
jgi:hypothetical protein